MTLGATQGILEGHSRIIHGQVRQPCLKASAFAMPDVSGCRNVKIGFRSEAHNQNMGRLYLAMTLIAACRIHFYNMPVTENFTQATHPLNIIRSIYQPGDLIVLKLDIDNRDLEMAIMSEIEKVSFTLHRLYAAVPGCLLDACSHKLDMLCRTRLCSTALLRFFMNSTTTIQVCAIFLLHGALLSAHITLYCTACVHNLRVT